MPDRAKSARLTLSGNEHDPCLLPLSAKRGGLDASRGKRGRTANEKCSKAPGAVRWLEIMLNRLIQGTTGAC